MLVRRALLGSAAAAAVGVPYVATETPLGQMIAGGGGEGEEATSSTEELSAPPAIKDIYSSIVPLGEVFRFQNTPQWIFQRWGRVSTVTAEGKLQGYRVPLVTGTSSFDLAGSLTYYFDTNRQIQRIVFHGHTGDPSPLIHIVTKQHGLKAQGTPDPGMILYQRWYHGEAASELRLQPMNVVDSTSPHTRYMVNLLLERPQDFRWLEQSQAATIQTHVGY